MIVSFIFKISCFLGIKQAKKIKPGWEFLGTDWEKYDLEPGKGGRTKKLKVHLTLRIHHNSIAGGWL